MEQKRCRTMDFQTSSSDSKFSPGRISEYSARVCPESSEERVTSQIEAMGANRGGSSSTATPVLLED